MGELRPKIDRWVAEGLITAEQGRAILASEEAGLPAPRKVPLVAEALGYLGASLALVAAFVVVAQFWAELEDWARLSLIALATVILWSAGWWVRGSDEPAVRRLTSFLWFLSSAGVAFFTGLVADDVLGARSRTTLLAVGLATALYAGVLWRLRPTALQHLALFAGVLTALSGLLGHLPTLPEEYYGLALWGFGLVWAVLAWGGIAPPQRAAYALGSLAMLVGAQGFAFDERSLRILLGLATSAGLIGVGVALGTVLLLGFGAVGIFVFVPQALFEWFGDTLGGPVVLFLTGVILLGAALVTARLKQAVTDEP